MAQRCSTSKATVCFGTALLSYIIYIIKTSGSPGSGYSYFVTVENGALYMPHSCQSQGTFLT